MNMVNKYEFMHAYNMIIQFLRIHFTINFLYH